MVWFTGLSGAGKTTLAQATATRLRRRVTILDGDEVRTHLSAGLGFSPEDRATNVRRVGWVAANIAYHGGLVLCALISPDDAVREQVRELVANYGAVFALVHVNTPLSVCAERDVKGHYAKATSGQLANFTGVSASYERPTHPDLVIDTDAGVDDTVAEILHFLMNRGVVTPADVAPIPEDDTEEVTEDNVKDPVAAG